MTRNWWWRFALVAGLLVLALVGMVPTVLGWFHNAAVNEQIETISRQCSKLELPCGTILYTEADGKIRVPLPDAEALDKARGALTPLLALGEPTVPSGQTTLAFSFPEPLPAWFRGLYNNRINLGLDLQGGIHLVLGVEVETALIDVMDRLSEEVETYCADEKLPCLKARVAETEPTLYVDFADRPSLDSAREKLASYLGSDMEPSVATGENKATLAFSMSSQLAEYRRANAVDQVLKTLRNRIDQMAVREALVAKQGDSSILVQIPGVKDPQRAMDLIGKTAHLMFKIVDDDDQSLFQYKTELPEGWKLDAETVSGAGGGVRSAPYLTARKDPEGKNIQVMREWLKGKMDADHEILFGEMEQARAAVGQDIFWRSYTLFRRTAMTGETITDARVNVDERQNRPYVSLTFDRQGARQFEEVTGENVQKRMAIILDDVVQSAPVIQSKIGGGRAMITLNALKPYRELMDEAQDLALVLRAGALQAPVHIEEIRTVGPTLGRDSIESGKWSIISGLIVVMLFMLIYYRQAGLFADVALASNVFLVLAVLAAFEGTLTMPGIAGIVLTMGMAVDANVIINERIREELLLDKTPRAAVEAGYDRAFWTIFDANVTTALAAFVLWTYGTGPVKGFAVTLLIGICTSVFTAIVVTRLLIDWVLVKRRPDTLSI